MRHARLVFIGFLVAALMLLLAGPAAAGLVKTGEFQIYFDQGTPQWSPGLNDGFPAPAAAAQWIQYPQTSG